MPVVAMIDGIKIEFYANEHPPPHYHARYAEHIAQIEISTGRVLKGALPPAQLRKVLDWQASRKQQLIEAWVSSELKQKPRRIDD